MSSVTFKQATRIFPGNKKPAVNSLDLHIEDGEFLVLVGPSGCGKSTSLRMLAGLEEVDHGQILIDGEDVTNVAPKDRDIAMVFQNYALYPHMSVAENMGFALKIAGVAKEEREARVLEAAKLLDLEELLDRKPKALSGGQRQRVAMGRAIVRSPKVFLMDEPLSNLDAKLRAQTRTQIAALQRRLGTTTVYVTHDQIEALTMGDRIAVLKEGILQQVGTPSDLYETPQNIFVAGFIGSPAMNIFEVDAPKFGSQKIPLSASQKENLGKAKLVIGFRPEDVTLSESGEGEEIQIDYVEELGADAYIYASTVGESPRELTIRVDGRKHPKAGDRVKASINLEHIHLFNAETEQRL